VRIVKQLMTFCVLVIAIQFFRKPEPSEEQVLDLPVPSIRQIEIRWRGSHATFSREGDTFSLVGPEDAVQAERDLAGKLDEPEGPSFLGLTSELPPSRRRELRMQRDVEVLLGALTQTSVLVFDEQEDGLEGTGLGEPIASIRLDHNSNSTRIDVGESTPIGTGRYFHVIPDGPLGILPLSIVASVERLATRSFGEDLF